MKKIGMVILALSVLNLIVAFIAMVNCAPAEAFTNKLYAFILLAVIGGLLCYSGRDKQDK